MHCSVSGVGHFLAPDEPSAIKTVQRYLSYLPSNWQGEPPAIDAAEPAGGDLRGMVPENDRQAYDMRRYIAALLDAGSFMQVHELWAKELVVGFGRLDGQVVGVVANNPMIKGGVLFVDSADKGARFIQLCDAFNVPLLFLADVPGYMVGTAVEREGIIRHGAKLITAVCEATVPKISVIVRKAYGAGLYAMSGPAFGTDATLALPTAKIAVMGAEAAINAVYYNRIQKISDEVEREAFVTKLREEYETDIDIVHLASELVVDAIVEPEQLRHDLIRRFAAYRNKNRDFSRRRHGVTPV
jgi:acetyl-CoA carboxylase carboxyltransferase component